jgi:hypothetical protein
MRLVFGKQRIDPLEAARCQTGERLIRLHQFQIAVDRQIEVLHDLIEHFTMLAREADDRLDFVGAAAGVNHGGQLNALGSGSKRQQTTQARQGLIEEKTSSDLFRIARRFSNKIAAGKPSL